MSAGRRGLCDACRKVKPDCLWTERVETGNRYVVCGGCRHYWRVIGHPLRHVDPDYPAPVDEPEAVPVGKR